MSNVATITFGPFRLSADRSMKGRIDRAIIVFVGAPPTSSTGTVDFYVGTDAYDVVTQYEANNPAYSIPMDKLAANNGVCYPHVAGGAGLIRMTNSETAAARRGTIEEIVLTVTEAGRNNLHTRANSS